MSYPSDRDLSSGWRYQPFGQLGLVLLYLEFISGAVWQAPSIIRRISLAEAKNYKRKHYDNIDGHIISPNGPYT